MMKTVILCGGMGTRLSEETHIKPKPMVEIGGRPILWHILRTDAHYGFKEFVLALGYKGEVIKDYFINYHPHTSDITVDLAKGAITYGNSTAEDWIVHLVDTGRATMTGGRLKRLEGLSRPERVGSKLDGSREALREGALGILVDPRRPDEIQAGILEALKRPRGVIPAGLDYFSFENFEQRCHQILQQIAIPGKSTGI
jgi:hypothetical protein